MSWRESELFFSFLFSRTLVAETQYVIGSIRCHHGLYFLEKKGIKPNNFSDINYQNGPVIPPNTHLSKM